MVWAVGIATTASGSTSQKRAILSRTSFGNVAVGAADDHIRLNADGAQFAHALLRRFGFEFAGAADCRQQGDVDEEAILAADFTTHLADGFEKGLALDIADGAADFDDDDIGIDAGVRRV